VALGALAGRDALPGPRWDFNGRMRDEFLNGTQFDSLLEAQVLTEAWRIDHNNHRPHSAHGWLTPVEFVERWVRGQQLQLAYWVAHQVGSPPGGLHDGTGEAGRHAAASMALRHGASSRALPTVADPVRARPRLPAPIPVSPAPEGGRG
jgi:Integrase core domain